MRVLVVNAGSSSIKLRLLAADDSVMAEDELDARSASPDGNALHQALAGPLREADAVGHRIVHGGARFSSAVRVDAEVTDELRALSELAPLHQPRALAALGAVSAALPDLPAVASFDTAFHATLPAAASTYALPVGWRDRWSIRRYGFHGLSHAYVARRAHEMLGSRANRLRIVSCHLGAGASLCAIADGDSQDTTMGFTPLEGLVMATRSGSVDPGLLLWLLERSEITVDQMAEQLEHESGLKALAGVSDMRVVLGRAAAGDDRARLGLDVYIHRLRAGIAAMAATLGGVDALVFTAGVGEHAAVVRELATERLGFLDIAIDRAANQGAVADADISARHAKARTLVIAAREDLVIAHEVRALLEG